MSISSVGASSPLSQTHLMNTSLLAKKQAQANKTPGEALIPEMGKATNELLKNIAPVTAPLAAVPPVTAPLAAAPLAAVPPVTAPLAAVPPVTAPQAPAPPPTVPQATAPPAGVPQVGAPPATVPQAGAPPAASKPTEAQLKAAEDFVQGCKANTAAGPGSMVFKVEISMDDFNYDPEYKSSEDTLAKERASVALGTLQTQLDRDMSDTLDDMVDENVDNIEKKSQEALAGETTVPTREAGVSALASEAVASSQAAMDDGIAELTAAKVSVASSSSDTGSDSRQKETKKIDVVV